MSYQVLARKWRPHAFKEVIGQAHVLTALENGLSQNRVHHAYLFSGTRGVGKTSIARLLAKSLNCEMGVTSTPCGQCANCQAIDQGRFVDLLEIDAASRTKVDDTRELLDNVQYKPAQGRYKVYLIDEVHMLSKHSFNALLKTLEEPPEYVKFLLATTDPQKLPITVLSRCLQFHLKAILPEQIEEQLTNILTQEQATFELPALTVIAKAADGSMRDALSLTDQALAFGAGHIEYNAVLKMLGTIDQSHLYYLLHFIVSGNSQKVFEKIQEFVQLGADFAALHQELASLCHHIALAQLQLNANVTNKTAVQLLAERLTPEEVQLFYQIALEGYKDYSYAPNGKIALEMTVMRLLAFKPANYIDVDEAMLVQANQVEAIEPANEVVNQANPVQQTSIKSDPVINPAVNNNNNHVGSTESVAIELPSNTQQAPIQTPVQTPISSNPDIVSNNVISKELNVTEETVKPKATQNSTASLDSSNSRNMLRSHRLKREALKKTEAATEDVSTRTEQLVAPTKKEASIDLKNTAAEDSLRNIDSIAMKVEPSALTKDKNSAFTNHEINPVNDFLSNNQELPPLTSYQDQASHQGYTSDDDSFDDPGFIDDSHLLENTETAESVPEVTEQIISAPTSQPSQTTTPQDSDYLPYANKRVEEVTAVPKENADISALQQPAHEQTDVLLVENSNLQSTEIDIANYVEDKMTDPWFLAIQEMQLVGFEKLLAKSAVMQTQGTSIVLTLHEPQQHLINNQSLCDDLKNKLRHYYGEKFNQTFSVDILVGKVEDNHTPMELELVVYQQYLDGAKSSIKNDPIVQTFVRDYAAKVYENSVVPL